MSKEITSQSLRKINIFAGILHLAQMAAVLALSNDFALPVTANYMSGPPGSTYADPVILFSTPVGLTVAIFLGLSALAHFIVASPQFFPRYSAGIAAKRNYFRWVEYSISSSVMIVLIAQVTGVAEISAIISIFGVKCFTAWCDLEPTLTAQSILFNMFALKADVCCFSDVSKQRVMDILNRPDQSNHESRCCKMKNYWQPIILLQIFHDRIPERIPDRRLVKLRRK